MKVRDVIKRLEQDGWRLARTKGSHRQYLVIYEKSETGWGAYAPDLPGVGVAGSSLEEVKQLIREAVEFHIEGMKQHGEKVPEPSAMTEYVKV